MEIKGLKKIVLRVKIRSHTNIIQGNKNVKYLREKTSPCCQSNNDGTLIINVPVEG